MIELIKEAQAMLLDRHPEERQLIYAIAVLPDDLRSAIVLAFQSLNPDSDE